MSVDYRLRSDERLTEATLRSDITKQRSGDDQSRQEIRFAHQYLRSDQKIRTWLAGLVSNDAPGVDLRLYGGGGIGKYFIKTNNKWFSVSGVLIATQENPEDGNTETNLEALYDNQPLSADAEKSDYGIISSLGWSN